MSGATPRGQPWTPALALPHRRDGLSARRMAVLYTFREPSLGRQMHRELMRNALLDLTTIMPATTCHRRSYVETYSRSMRPPLPPAPPGPAPHRPPRVPARF